MPQRKRRGQPQWSRSPGKGSRLDRCGLGRLSGDSSQVSNEVSASHAGGNDEYNNDVDVEMNTQINVGVIEAVGTGVPEAAGTGGGVLASDVGGGGGAMPSVAEAARGQVNEPVEDVIGSVVGGSTTEATGGMVAAPTAPQAGGAGGVNGGEGLCMHDSDTILNDRVRDTIIQAQERTVSKVLQEMAWNGPHRFLVPLCRLVQSHWVRSAYDLNMAIYSSFAEVGFGSTTGTFIVSPTFPGTGRTDCCLGEGTGKAPEELIYNISKSKMSFAEQSVCLELLNTWLRNNEKRCEIRMEKVMKEKAYISQSIAAGEEMLQVWDEKFLSSTRTGNGWLPRGGTSSAEFKNQPGQPFLARRMVYRYLKYSPGAPVYTTGVLQKLLTRGKKLGMYEPEFYCPCTHERELCPWYLELVEQMPTSDFELDLYLECHPEALSDCDNDIIEVQQLNLEVSTQETIQEMANPNTVEPEEIVQEIPAQEIPVPAPRNPRRGRHETFHENVAESSHQSFRRTKTFFPSLPTATDDDLEELSSAAMHKQVRPLSPMASVGEVAILIGDYTQLLDATSRELYMLDRWIHGLGQLTPYGKIDFIFFDLPGMAPPQGDTPSWNVLQAQHISQALKVASSFMTYEGVVVMILPRSLMWEGLLAHLADNDDGFVEFSSGYLLSSMAVDTKGTSSVSVHTLDLDDMDDHMDQSQFHLPIYAERMAQHYIQHEPITKRLVHVEPIIYMSLWNTLNT
ncbi:hypothetical protein SELMODRAFT_430516 [Selaginella moellendorffii]|uniref:Uncharacterized protein n=1 Tax=Selaginella moellendorffii TaxID=88036 RepID=D8T9N1_SELML|nr:hypothetical protein SELMODRAFT_430516 [Selaginella moellendorffii]